MADIHGMKWIDTTGASLGYKNVDGKPRISSMSYLHDIGEGNVTDHASWSKIGYTPTMTTAESDVWSFAGAYVFPAVAAGMQIVSSSASDTGTSIKNGTSTGGSLTTLIDTGANFNAATAVSIGDYVILDKAGTTPEWGVVTAVTSNTTLTLNSGFSSVGVGGPGRVYQVLRTVATTGAQAIRFEYLTNAYAEKSEIVLLNGTNAVTTVNTDIYRINSFRTIAAGSNYKAVGNLSLQSVGGGTTYSYITAGYTRARNVQYTVPASKTLYVAEINWGFGYSGTNQIHYCRMYTRANMDSVTGFKTGLIFYPYTEVVLAQGGTISISLPVPTKLKSGIDIKVSGIATISGVAYCTLRGWLETA